jgi:CRISPR-associated protein Cmr2
VQEFIASARRSRDLWFGSQLLSELSKTAAHTIVQHNTLDQLIFPSPKEESALKPDSPFNVANKIVAIINQEPRQLAMALKGDMHLRLDRLRKDAFEKIQGPYNEKMALQHIDDLVECLWAALPLPSDHDYAQVRKDLDALMAARKNTRTFSPVQGGSSLPKSSLDGQRETVIFKAADDTLTDEQLRHQYDIKRGEHLCGVGLFKRWGHIGKRKGFPSTSHIAALPLLHRMEKQHNDMNLLKKHWQTCLEHYRAQQPETAREEYISGYKEHPILKYHDGSILFEEHEALQTFFTNIASVLHMLPGQLKPPPYYALLLADGDNMGKAIDHQQTVDNHRALSQTLAGFANRVRTMVEQHEGALIYAGGDDVLALVPLHAVLECATALAESFNKCMQEFSFEDTPVTLSVGIAVAHHIEPLTDALNLARRAEQSAKKVPGKNALAVAVSKRSGSETIVQGRRQSLSRRLSMFTAMHQHDDIPDGAAYELRDLATRLNVPQDDTHYSILQEAMYKETLRILKRKKARQGQVALAETALPELDHELTEAIKETSSLPLQQFADELIIARIFAQAMHLAGKEASTGEEYTR